MSVPLPGRFPVTFEPGCVSPGVTGNTRMIIACAASCA